MSDALDPAKLPAFHSAEEILSHPRFPAARDELVRAMLALYENKPFLTRLLLEAGRNILFVSTMCLYAGYDEADRATWPTMRLVKGTTAAQGVSSPRRLHGLISQFIDTGYLELRSSSQDRRVRLLTPTAKMLAQDQDWLVSHYLPLQVLFPEPGYARIMQRDPSFQMVQRRTAAKFFALGAQILEAHSVVMRFMTRDAGIMVLLKLLQLSGAMGDAAGEEIFYSDIANRFGISRTHVRKILQEAERDGLVHIVKDGGRFVTVTPELVQAFDSFLAAGMSGHDLIYQLALRADP